MAADIDFFVMHDTSCAGRVASNANDGRDIAGHNQTIAATVAGNVSTDETYGSVLTLAGDFAAYYDSLVARGGTTQARIVALADHAFISAFTGAATTTAGNARVLNCSATSITLILQTNAAYNAGTTYAAGDRVTYEGVVWASRLGSNTANTPSLDTAAGVKYWARIDVVLRGQAVTTSLTGLSAVVLGTGPKLTVGNALASTVAGNRVFLCGNASNIYQHDTVSFSKTSNYGTRALPIEVIGADWYGKPQPGATIRGGQKTKVRPTPAFTLNNDFAAVASSATNILVIRGIEFDGRDSDDRRAARVVLDAYNANDIGTLSCCNVVGSNGNAGYQAFANGSNWTVERCIFDNNTSHGMKVYGTMACVIANCVFSNTLKLAGSFGHGLSLENYEPCFVVGNECYGNEGDGIHQKGIGTRAQNKIVNNTLYGNGGSGFDSNDSVTAGHWDVLLGNSSVANGAYGYSLPTGLETTFADFNHAHANATAVTNIAGGLPGMGNLKGDPFVVDAVNHNFKVLAGSPLLTADPNGKFGAGLPQATSRNRYIDDLG